MDVQRPAANKLAHHTPHKSQTLMRGAVTKPGDSLKRQTKAVSHSDAILQQPKFEVVPKLSHPKVDPERAQRSAQIPQSESVRRFVDASAFQPAPTPAPAPVSTPESVPAPEPVAVKPVLAETAAAHAVAAPSVAASSMDVFERALQRANSHMELPGEHKQKKAKHRSLKPGLGKRVLSIGAASLAVVMLVGFFAVQNKANLTVRYASAKAGFSATLPTYKPEGFGIGKFTYSPGLVGVTYTSDLSADQAFTLTQKKSNWDSSSLRSDYLASQGEFKTVQSAGRTIYIYGENNATWVNGGVWYNVTSGGNLSSGELVSLANSI